MDHSFIGLMAMVSLYLVVIKFIIKFLSLSAKGWFLLNSKNLPKTSSLILGNQTPKPYCNYNRESGAFTPKLPPFKAKTSKTFKF